MRGWVLFLVACALLGASVADSAELPRRGYLGVRLKDIPPSVLETSGLPGPGLEITRILDGGSAGAAGITPSDTIVELNGVPVTTVAAFVAEVADSREGETINLGVWRGGRRETVKMKVVGFPREEYPTFDIRYSHVEVEGERYRTVITVPRKDALADSLGRVPAVFFVQDVGCFGVESPYESMAYKKIAYDLTEAGLLTVRLDKPGCGDSEGGPCAEESFAGELAAYAAGLDAVLDIPEVDPSRVVLFGHGMGGVMAPYLAQDRSLAGLVVVGTIYGDWREYELLALERRNLLDGVMPAETSKQLAVVREFQDRFYGQGEPMLDIVRGNPIMQKLYPDAPLLYAGKIDTYFREVEALDVPLQWHLIKTPTLVLWGESDFVSRPEDHQALADVLVEDGVDATYKVLSRTDHWFNRATSFESSARQNPVGGSVQPEVVSVVVRWVRGLER